MKIVAFSVFFILTEGLGENILKALTSHYYQKLCHACQKAPPQKLRRAATTMARLLYFVMLGIIFIIFYPCIKS